ncbi:hypothetical protein GCM10018779_10980 [Streptomyces griseocarneus]|nr:hypothetical protein GCM10018779_10980 [Streptomyces griseocarneus]
MGTNDTAPPVPEPSPLPRWHALLPAVITACPATPSPNAPWVWVIVVLIAILSLQSKKSKQRFA